MSNQDKHLKISVYNYIISLFIFSILLTSCASEQLMKNVEVLAPGETVVYGKVSLFKDNIWTPYAHYLLLLTPENNVIKSFEVSNENTKPNDFYLSLNSGEYTILKLLSTRGDSYQEIPIRANFKVPEGIRSVYIGDLLWDEKCNCFQIHDNFRNALTALRIKFPNEEMKSTKSLMHIEVLGTVKGFKHICEQSWEIYCTENFRGVEPVYPKPLGSKVDSLLPTFIWKPSTNNEVTYDLIIFEQIIYTPDNMINYPTSGRVILYEENIYESSYKLIQPLKPNSKYYWSVRLRKGDIVSNWSTFSYFWTVLIATGSGSNLLFTFATPAAAK